jgi:hypothetical protein
VRIEQRHRHRHRPVIGHQLDKFASLEMGLHVIGRNLE